MAPLPLEFDDYENNQILEIPKGKYELQGSNIIRVRLRMSDTRKQRVMSQLIEGAPYFLSVGHTHGAFTLDRFVMTAAQPDNQLLVDLSYIGGYDLELFEAALSGKQEKLIMKKLQVWRVLLLNICRSYMIKKKICLFMTVNCVMDLVIIYMD